LDWNSNRLEIRKFNERKKLWVFPQLGTRRDQWERAERKSFTSMKSLLHRRIDPEIAKKVLAGWLVSGAGYGGLLAYDFLLGLKVGQGDQVREAAVIFSLCWLAAVMILAWARQISLATSIGVSCLLLVVAFNLPRKAYLHGLARAASAPGFVEQLSRWAYSTGLDGRADLSIEADRLPTFLYDWLGKPRVKAPRGYLRIVNAFRAQTNPPRSFEFGSICFSFAYEPYGIGSREIRKNVYLYAQ
jgi:hypothetical protein